SPARKANRCARSGSSANQVRRSGVRESWWACRPAQARVPAASIGAGITSAPRAAVLVTQCLAVAAVCRRSGRTDRQAKATVWPYGTRTGPGRGGRPRAGRLGGIAQGGREGGG